MARARADRVSGRPMGELGYRGEAIGTLNLLFLCGLSSSNTSILISVEDRCIRKEYALKTSIFTPT